ncbi:MAG: hypothetical protein J6T73_02110 [Clostridia bacterium]|nr:hypothetical protein [Clostridia bacterium]
MKRYAIKLLAFTLCLFLLCGILPVNAGQAVTTVKHYTVPSYLGFIPAAKVTAGDINGDGKVNNKDLTRLFQYLSDWEVDVVEAALDTNGDKKVNNKDLTRLFQYLSDWDVQIFPLQSDCEHSGGTATCTAKAICEKCGEEYGELDPYNHAGGTEIRGAYSATCTNSGYTGDTYCSACGEKISTGGYINPTGNHNYSLETVDPTCFDVGYTRYTCSDCGYSYVDDYVAVLEHTGGTATCHSGAICERCGTEYGGWDYSNHDGGTRTEGAYEPTATEDGYSGNVICNGCNTVLSYGHYYAHTHTGGEATYYQKSVCTVCQNEYGDYKQILAYDQLNENQKGMYEILDTAVKNLELSRIYVDEFATDPVVGESDINVAFRALSYDKPEYFWIPRSYSVGTVVNSRTGQLIDIYVSFAKEAVPYGEFHISPAQKASMQTVFEKKVNEIVAEAMTYNSVFDREVFIHDYLCRNITYNMEAAMDPTADYQSFTAYGALVNKTCVCEGYSRAMQIICQRLDIPCGLVTGQYVSWDPDSEELVYTLHMWNIINPGDGCYYLDVTFDDLDMDDYPYVCTHYCFNMDEDYAAVDHILDAQYQPGSDYSNVNIEYNFFNTHGTHYSMFYYSKLDAYIDSDTLYAVAAYINEAKKSGATVADFLFNDDVYTAAEAMKQINRILKEKYGYAKGLSYGYGFYQNWLFVWLAPNT